MVDDDDEDNELNAYNKKMAKEKIEIEFETIKFEDIFTQTQNRDTRDQNEETEEEDETKEKAQIKLNFSQIQDESIESNTVVFIYQEIQNNKSHTIITFDIFK